MACFVAKGLSNLPDAEIQPLIKIDERVVSPDLPSQLVPGDEPAMSFEEKGEHSSRLRRQPDRSACSAKLARSRVEFEKAKPVDAWASHGEVPRAEENDGA